MAVVMTSIVIEDLGSGSELKRQYTVELGFKLSSTPLKATLFSGKYEFFFPLKLSIMVYEKNTKLEIVSLGSERDDLG